LRTYVVRRLYLTIPTIIGLTIIVFLAVRLLPGDVIDAMSGAQVAVDEARRQAIRERLGLADPLYIQYLNWVGDIFSGELGVSLRNAQPLREVFLRALPVTVELGVLAGLMASLIGIPLGLVSALKPNSFLDFAARLFGLIGLSFPNFWLATLVILMTSLTLRWIPGLSYIPIWQDPVGNLRQMLLPALVLSFQLMAIAMRMTRATMLEVLRQDYMRTAQAKGLKPAKMVTRHALRNALIPIITIVGVQFGYLLSGSVIIEQIFGLPGIGWFFLQGLIDRDYPVVQIMALFMVCVFVLLNFITDLIYGYIDPRIRFEGLD
jgi:peptide/nickel transport system permease protein